MSRGTVNLPKYKNGYRRIKPTHGECVLRNRVVNALPKVGDLVVLEEIVFVNNTIQYQLCQSRLDAWSRPRLYTVVGYTHGMDNPLEPKNKMICTYRVGDVELSQSISVLPITTGSMRTVMASPRKLKIWRYL